MNRFRETNDIKKDCTKCFYFSSFRHEYDNDDLESEEYGRCNNPLNQELDETFGEGYICDLFNSYDEIEKTQGWNAVIKKAMEQPVFILAKLLSIDELFKELTPQEYCNQIYTGGRHVGKSNDMMDAIEQSLIEEGVYDFYGAKAHQIEDLGVALKERGLHINVEPIYKTQHMLSNPFQKPQKGEYKIVGYKLSIKK